MKKLGLLFIFSCLTLITGCNGHSGENTDTSEPVSVSSITLSLTNQDGESGKSFERYDVITVVATTFDDKSKTVSNARVDFSSDLGVFNSSSKLSDSSGNAVVSLTNNDLEIGAGTITATVGEITATIDFEYTDGEPGLNLPNLDTAMFLNGVAVTQFKANEQVQIVSRLTDENDNPLSGEIISYTADVSTLTPLTALTNEEGVANVTLSTTTENIGAGTITASYVKDELTTYNQFNYEILAADAIVDNEVRLGYFNESEQFVEGQIKLSVDNNTISAGGTLGLTVDLVDELGNRITSPTPVTFTSNCVLNESASIDETVLSINGQANSTFEDIKCAGSAGTEDIIIASVSVNGIVNTANANISITGETLGSIEFISAEPASIVLKGTGGLNKQENSTLTFKVKSELGNLLPQQEVTFALDTTAGGISLSRTSGFTNSQGLVTTQVQAGTVPTSVRVTAKAVMNVNNEEIVVQSQSDLLSVNTGLPEQRSFTISPTLLNPEADAINGVTVDVTAWLADNFNNPVPDGTTVNFTTEGGVIQPSCTTLNGSCTVTWTSAAPRVDDHRITILATALGHESFFDANGNNTFDDADGTAIVDQGVSSGFSSLNASSGFIDMSEAWRDDNENMLKDAGEPFIDLDGNESFDREDGLFNGPQCDGALCAAESLQKTHVRKAAVIVMSGSHALFELTNNSGTIIFEDNSGTVNDIPGIADGSSQNFVFSFTDSAIQTLPQGTTVSVESNAGTIEGTTNFVVPNTASRGGQSISFYMINELGGDPETAILTINITTPAGILTSMQTVIELL